MNVFKTVTQWLFVVCLPVMLLTGSVSAAANCPWVYQHGFEKFGISQVTGLAPAELDKAARGLRSYFNSSQEYIDITVEKDGQPFQLFNEREILHLKDVKGLFRLIYKILLGTLIYILLFLGACLFWWRDRKRLGNGLFFGGGLTLVMIIVLGLVIIFDFDQFFLQFHLLSFANDFWELDPTRDYLIMMFPQDFWFDAALYCALATVAGAIITGGLGWWSRRKAA